MQVFNSKERIGDITVINANVVRVGETVVTIGGQQRGFSSLDIDFSQTGIGGIDDGNRLNGGRYKIFAVVNNNITGLIASLADAPAGFTNFAYIGTVINNDTGLIVVEIPTLVNENLIINGDMRISQRGNYTGGSTIYDGRFMVDRWRMSARAGLSGNATLIHYPDLNTIKLRADMDSDTVDKFYIGCYQKFGDYMICADRYVTFSCDLRHDKGVRFQIYDGVKSHSLYHRGNGTFERVILTVKISPNPTMVWCGIFLDNSGGTREMFYSGDTLEIRNAKLELGTVATPFVSRPFSEELLLCQRYFEVLLHSIKSMSAGDVSGYSYAEWSYKVTKRVVPTIDITGSTGAITSSNKDGVLIYSTNAYPFFSAGNTADAEIY